MNRKSLGIFFTILMISNISAAEEAGENKVIIGTERFSPPFMAIKPGESITFDNKSGVEHSITGISNGFEFSIKKLQPGKTASVDFPVKGIIDLACEYHKDMKMSLFVR